jgi:hypothetical protein
VQCLENEMGSIVLGRDCEGRTFQHLLSLHIVYDILGVFENITKEMVYSIGLCFIWYIERMCFNEKSSV